MVSNWELRKNLPDAIYVRQLANLYSIERRELFWAWGEAKADGAPGKALKKPVPMRPKHHRPWTALMKLRLLEGGRNESV